MAELREVSGEVSALVPRKPDQEIATDLKVKAAGPATMLAEIMNEARGHGLILNFNIGPNQFGRIGVNDITVIKPL